MISFENMGTRDMLDHHLGNLVQGNDGLVRSALRGKSEYDANKLREQTESHVKGIESVYGSASPEDKGKLEKFCEVVLNIPDKPEQNYIDNLYKEYDKVKDISKNL